MNLRLGIQVRLASLLLLTLPVSAIAQSQVLEVRAAAEFRVSPISSPEISQRVANAVAKRRALNETVVRLAQLPEIKSVPIQTSALEALLPALVNVSVESQRSSKDNAGRTVFHTDAIVRLDTRKISQTSVALSRVFSGMSLQDNGVPFCIVASFASTTSDTTALICFQNSEGATGNNIGVSCIHHDLSVH